MPYCPECGKEVGAADRFCQACGAELGQPGGAAGGDQLDEGGHTGRGDPDRGIDYGQSRRPGSANSQQSGWDTPAGQSSRRTGRGGQAGRRTGRGGRPQQAGSGEQAQQAGRGGRPQQPARGRRAQRADDTGLVSFSLSYPAGSGAGGLVLGSLAVAFVWLVVPFFLLAGYFVRLAAAAAAGRPEPPGFDDWTGMTKDGVVLVFGSLPIWLPYWVLAFLAAEASVLLYFGLTLFGSYLFPAIFVNYAVERRFQALYGVSTLTDLATTSSYLVGYLISVFLINGIGTIVVVVLLIVSGITVVGILLWPLIFLYWYAVNAALWGAVYRRVMGPATIPDQPTSPRQQQQRPHQQQRSQQQRY